MAVTLTTGCDKLCNQLLKQLWIICVAHVSAVVAVRPWQQWPGGSDRAAAEPTAAHGSLMSTHSKSDDL
jgi:hypothetical protein